MYEIVISKNFSKKFRKLPLTIQLRVKGILNLLKDELIGNPLKGDFFGYYSIHFEHNKYRLIYYKEKNELKILVLEVGKRNDEFYKILKKYL